MRRLPARRPSENRFQTASSFSRLPRRNMQRTPPPAHGTQNSLCRSGRRLCPPAALRPSENTKAVFQTASA
ncbi:hypothetical protein [Kingella potus]|nr:hypothetical protein [Kingella potus]